MLYFAYGSNLNKEEMKSRCPSAVYLGVATIKAYELEFRYYLSIKENKDETLLVGVWDIKDKNDLEHLDFYEGYPQLYSKKMVKGLLNNSIIDGLIYIMNDNKYCYKSNTSPSKQYLLRCLEGYLDCNINYIQLIDAYNKTL